VAPAPAAADKAGVLASKATPREQALIAAVSTRYSKDADANRAPLDAADSTGFAAATERQLGSDAVICHGSASGV
jgi:hypothetical protein